MAARSRPQRVAVVSESAQDRAVRAGDPGGLSDGERADCVAVLAAFQAYSAGDDEAARGHLAGVGLRSPFLEWRVFLRGLMAYSAGDTAKALENFARLNPERLPARLAAPVVAGLGDGGVPAAGASAATKALFADPVLDKLVAVRQALGAGRGNDAAFKLLPATLPLLKKRSPEALRAFKDVFYHAVRRNGRPAELQKLVKHFGVYEADPQFHKLQALAHEEIGSLVASAEHWLAYEAWLESSPLPWPDALKRRARAVIRYRLARQVEAHAEFSTKRVKPDPAPHWRKAIELAPDWELPASDYFDYLLNKGEVAEAEAVAVAFLNVRPDSRVVLDELAAHYAATKRPAEALALRERLLALNPLDRETRRLVARSCLAVARHAAPTAKPAESLARLAAGAKLADDSMRVAFAVAAWLVRHKLGDPDAEAELRAAESVTDAALEIAYLTAVEVVLYKLKPAFKTTANKLLADRLDAPVAAGELLRALSALELFAADGPAYRGLPAHRTRMLELVGVAVTAAADPAAVGPLLAHPVVAAQPKLVVKWLKPLRARFPKNAMLAMTEIEAELTLKPSRPPMRLLELLILVAGSTDPADADRAGRAGLLLEEIFGMVRRPLA